MQTISKVIKLPLEAEVLTFRALDGQSRICNWLYNHLVEKACSLKSEFIKTGNQELIKTLYTERGLRNLVPALKVEFPFLRSVHSSPIKNVALRLSSSIQTHQKSRKGLRKGNKTGWPKFRSWSANWFSLLYDEPNKGFKMQGHLLRISLGLGEESKRQSLEFNVKDAYLLKGHVIRNMRIVKQMGLYYAIFTVQVEAPIRKPIKNVIALDPNHKNLAYGVDTCGRSIEIASPTFLKSYDKRIDILKGKRDHCKRKAHLKAVFDQNGNPTGKEYWKSSKRWEKLNRTLERLQNKRREQTKTFIYTIAHRLYKNYDCVAIGDYTPKGEGISTQMRRAMNNRSLIGRFKEALSWVGQKSGKTFIEYDEKGTTRTCHCCYHIVEDGIPVHMRIWKCPTCQITHIRDENAAKNGLIRVLRDLGKNCGTEVPLVSCSDPIQVTEWCAWRALPSGVNN
ncbi:MAG: RNA-guided endonuclease InsQ/TnpB family protein, partial [Chlamydiales bacterium]